MQIRELDLTELETAYEVVRELRDLDYDTFETTVYDMRHQAYKMLGVFEDGKLITYAGVNVQTCLAFGRHLFVFDLITRASHRSRGYGGQMLAYLEDYARLFQCRSIVLTSGTQRLDAHRFYEQSGFERRSFAFIRTL